jgi:hypothetical protein
MIDFRYHLVSLVSVFLALAVGIVLGAGPLKDQLGKELNDRVEGLRQERTDLKEQLDTANVALKHRDDFFGAVTPSLVSGQLTNRSVVIVSLPQVEENTDALNDAITTAGGTVTGRVSVKDAWSDPAKVDARTKVVTDLAAALPTGTVPSSGETDVRLANLLASALVSVGADPVGKSTDTSSTVLKALKSADLIQVNGNLSGLAGGALVLAPANVVNTTAGEAAPTDEVLNSYIAVAAALDTASGGAVVTGPASSATDGGVITAIRKDDTAKSQVSTVDTGSTPMGLITAVMAMREQLSGGSSGAYGFGSGAQDLLPALVAAAPGVTPTPTATKK